MNYTINDADLLNFVLQVVALFHQLEQVSHGNSAVMEAKK